MNEEEYDRLYLIYRGLRHVNKLKPRQAAAVLNLAPEVACELEGQYLLQAGDLPQVEDCQCPACVEQRQPRKETLAANFDFSVYPLCVVTPRAFQRAQYWATIALMVVFAQSAGWIGWLLAVLWGVAGGLAWREDLARERELMQRDSIKVYELSQSAEAAEAANSEKAVRSPHD